jgi:hypothetical protein
VIFFCHDIINGVAERIKSLAHIPSFHLPAAVLILILRIPPRHSEGILQISRCFFCTVTPQISPKKKISETLGKMPVFLHREVGRMEAAPGMALDAHHEESSVSCLRKLSIGVSAFP